MIAVESVGKRFGPLRALEDVTFTVPAGARLGILGRNGAGKTTLLRILTGYLLPTSGTATVGGFDVVREPDPVRRMIGYACEEPKLYPEMPVRSFLRFVARLRRVEEAEVSVRIDAVLRQFDLERVGNRLIGNLSKGYRHRVSLAQALLHEPAVLVCDEPTVGLDPAQQLETRDLLLRLGASRTLVLTTHDLGEAAALCQIVVVLDHGRVVAADAVESLGGRDGLARLFVRTRVDRE